LTVSSNRILACYYTLKRRNKKCCQFFLRSVSKTSFRPLFHSIFFAKPCHISLEVKLERSLLPPPGRQQGLRECKKLKSFSRPLGPHTTAHSDSQPQLGSASRHARRVLSLTHQRLGGSGHQLDAAAAMISKFLALAWGNTES
jgi:hypothetical protein